MAVADGDGRLTGPRQLLRSLGLVVPWAWLPHLLVLRIAGMEGRGGGSSSTHHSRACERRPGCSVAHPAPAASCWPQQCLLLLHSPSSPPPPTLTWTPLNVKLGERLRGSAVPLLSYSPGPGLSLLKLGGAFMPMVRAGALRRVDSREWPPGRLMSGEWKYAPAAAPANPVDHRPSLLLALPPRKLAQMKRSRPGDDRLLLRAPLYDGRAQFVGAARSTFAHLALAALRTGRPRQSAAPWAR